MIRTTIISILYRYFSKLSREKCIIKNNFISCTIFLDNLEKYLYNRDMKINFQNHSFSSPLDLLFHLHLVYGDEFKHQDYILEDKYFYIYYNLKEKFPNQEFTLESVKALLSEELALGHIKLNANESEKLQFSEKHSLKDFR